MFVPCLPQNCSINKQDDGLHSDQNSRINSQQGTPNRSPIHSPELRHKLFQLAEERRDEELIEEANSLPQFHEDENQETTEASENVTVENTVILENDETDTTDTADVVITLSDPVASTSGQQAASNDVADDEPAASDVAGETETDDEHELSQSAATEESVVTEALNSDAVTGLTMDENHFSSPLTGSLMGSPVSPRRPSSHPSEDSFISEVRGGEWPSCVLCLSSIVQSLTVNWFPFKIAAGHIQDCTMILPLLFYF